MAIDREFMLQWAAQRAGFNDGQLDALRRRDYKTLLAEYSVPASEPELDLADDAAPDPPAPSVRVELARAARGLAAVRQQRDAALELVGQLAARLGSCPRCWGTDARCETCGGRGSPGHFPPDPHLREWLGPALARTTDTADAAGPRTT